MASCNTECYGIGEMPSPNHKGWRTSSGSHGDDMDSDGVVRKSEIFVITRGNASRPTSLTGPQPYTGEETRVPPVCCRFPLSAGWNLERHTRRKSDGRIPRPSGRGGGQRERPSLLLTKALCTTFLSFAQWKLTVRPISLMCAVDHFISRNLHHLYTPLPRHLSSDRAWPFR